MKNPLIPMGAVTGNLSREEISEILKKYHDVGIRQFLVYPRDGCDIPYMSERWLEICGDFIECAEALGMDIWLYDEFNWPSGTCKGKVMAENPEFYAKEIVRTESGYEIVKKPDYADILDERATEVFIKNTHEVYYSRFGKYFGNVIKGIFSDEPSMAYYSEKSGYPYSNGIENDYFEKTGRDFFEDFLHSDESFDELYRELLETRFRNNFIGKIRRWCDSRNILMTGHLFAESVLSDTVFGNGNSIAAVSGFSLPGVDEIFTYTSTKDAEWLTFGTAQSAILKNKNGGLVETLALGPTDIIPARISQMLTLEAMFGIDRFVLAVSAADARGNVRKNGYYNPTNYMNPWFSGYGLLGKNAQTAAELAHKKTAFELAVRLPYSSVRKNLTKHPEKAEAISGKTKTLLSYLTAHQIQWLLTDEAEKTDLPVLSYDESTDVLSLVDDFIKKNPLPFRICEKDGELAENVFVRRFESGEAIVLDLDDSDESRELIFEKDGEKTLFTLSGRGYVFIEKGKKPELIKSEAVLDMTDKIRFKLSLDRENTLRCNIRKDKLSYTFKADCDLSVRFLRREYMYDGEILLDGKVLEFSEKAENPVFGIAQLYHASATMLIKEGLHTVSVDRSAESEPFLPSCFIVGCFSSHLEENLDVIGKLPDEVPCRRLDQFDGDFEIIPQFAGGISYEAEIDVPKCASLEICGCDLYTRVYMDGELIGEKFSDYLYEIPERFAGKSCKVKIEQFTTIGPFFGRYRDCITDGDGAPWTPITEWFPHKYEKCGITKFVFRK